MTLPIFKVGDTIKVASQLLEDDGTPFDISTKTIRSVLKGQGQEVLGTNQLIGAFSVITTFVTTGLPNGKYQTDIRFTEGTESFSTPTVVIDLQPRIS